MNSKPITHIILAAVLGTVLATLVSCSGNDSEARKARDTGHPILLVSSVDEGASAVTWHSILAERFGGCDLLPLADGFGGLGRDLGPRELIVISNGALAHFDSLEILTLQKTVADEALVMLLDRPGPEWQSVTGLRTVGRADLPVRWPENTWSVWQSGGNPGTGRREATSRRAPSPSLDLGLEYLVQRPQAQGVRNVGTPFDVPAVWWRGEGEGAWISLSLPLAELVEALSRDTHLDPRQQQRWISAVVESTLNPDVFPQPFLRVWPRPTPEAPQTRDQSELDSTRERLTWHLQATQDGGHRFEIRGGSPETAIELAIPLKWRGQVLSNWDCDWEGVRSRKVVGPDREWRLMRAPADQGRLELRYRQAQNTSLWR